MPARTASRCTSSVVAADRAMIGSRRYRPPLSARISLVAQFAYMVLFSASFFFEGLTGITITVGAIVTLAILMAFTAKVDWNEVFKKVPKVVKTSQPPRLVT